MAVTREKNKIRKIRGNSSKSSRSVVLGKKKVNSNPQKFDHPGMLIGVRVPINVGKNGDCIIVKARSLSDL